MSLQKSFSIRKGDIEKRWFLVDAEGIRVGRLATRICNVLRGKNKVTYTPHMNCGDCVVIINADKVVFSGRKYTDKIYYWHTGYPGGIKSATPKDMHLNNKPLRVLDKAIKRMLPKNSLGRDLYRNLYMYEGSEHPHSGQVPEVLDILKLK